MNITGIGAVLHSYRAPDYDIHIVASSEGRIRAIVSKALSFREVAVQGTPRHIDLLNEQEVIAAKEALKNCHIQLDSLQVQVNPKLKGGGPPLERDLDRMGTWRTYQSKGTDAAEEAFFKEAISTAVALTGNPILIFSYGVLLRMFEGMDNAAQSAQIEQRIRQLETRMNAGGSPAKQGYDIFMQFLRSSITNPADQRRVARNLFQIINEKKQEVIDQPHAPARRQELKALVDCVHFATTALSDKTLANQVLKVGEASLSFAQAFFMVRDLGGIAAAGISGMIGPIGLALTGITTLASLVFGEEVFPEIAGQVQGLNGQAAQLRTMIDLRFDRLEALFADFDRRVFEQFSQLHGSIAELRAFCEESYRVINLKLDRINAYLTAGLTQLAVLQYNQRKVEAQNYLRLGTITVERHDNYLNHFNAWAREHSKNPLFTGALHENHEPEDDVALLRTGIPENLLHYLSHHPLYHPLTAIELNLANPYLWADAAEAYMQVRLNTPRFDATYGVNHLPLLLDIYRTGLELKQFISDLQQNHHLFDRLLDEYETHLALLCAANQDPHIRAHFDAAYYLLIAYCNLAFQQSVKHDLIFASYFKNQGNRRLRLVNSQDIQALIQDANQAPYATQRAHLLQELRTDLQRTFTYFAEVLEQKAQHRNDSHFLITSTLQRLWDFGSRYFPNAPEFAPNAYPAAAAPHFTNVNAILPNDIFWAVFSGNPTAVQGLIANHSVTDSLGRTPLHYACRTGQLDIATRLVDAGANVNARDQGGELPIYLARRYQRPEIESFFCQEAPHAIATTGFLEKKSIKRH